MATPNKPQTPDTEPKLVIWVDPQTGEESMVTSERYHELSRENGAEGDEPTPEVQEFAELALETAINLDNVPTLNEQRIASRIPIPASMEELGESGTVIFCAKREATAKLPDNTVSKGYVLLWTKDKIAFHTTFVGAVVLLRELERMNLPFKAKIVKKGRTWVFNGG